MGVTPAGLVDFGRDVTLRGSSVEVRCTPGPEISLRWGTLALADPWWPEMLPEVQVAAIGKGIRRTQLSTIELPREGRPLPVPMSCAASIGPVDRVTSWQPTIQRERHFNLDSDSALGAFYDITDAAVLRPLFTDDEHMQGIYNRALEERIVPMEADGRVVAVVFLCPDGSGLYPSWTGYDKDMQAVAVLVDLKLLDDAV